MHRVLLLTALAIHAQDRGENTFQPGTQWDLVGEGYQLTADSTVDKDGNVFFTDARRNRIMKIDLDGKISTWKENSNDSHGVAMGPDGRLYAGQHDLKRIVAFAADGTESVITEGIQTHHLTVTPRNRIYFTVPPAHQVWLADRTGQKRVVHEGLNWPRGVHASPDESHLFVGDSKTKWIWSFRIQPDGSLTDGRQFCALETATGKTDADAGGMAFDEQGLLYIATSLDIQVCDQRGRLIARIDTPGNEGLANLFFAGRGRQWLYVTDGDKLYRRPIRRL